MFLFPDTFHSLSATERSTMNNKPHSNTSLQVRSIQVVITTYGTVMNHNC
ncbi:protein of unknown function [Candidatus Nitrosocosmicus franklandus]|uniref:Uncharacterized protein n=1 Tax=Candidatus Nitrosocosmicus franklandianus TaxID=1798806 RepID=A0A484I5P0_9ARCH|nr:protein of unknown function [Candidatus Nitrosocosmicus franklandus]